MQLYFNFSELVMSYKFMTTFEFFLFTVVRNQGGGSSLILARKNNCDDLSSPPMILSAFPGVYECH